MNVFHTHSKIVQDYATYIHSFLNIADPQIREHVERELSHGKLWPEPLLQFNPAFEIAGSVAGLAQSGALHPELADIFKGYSLYRHQVEAIQLGTHRHLRHRLRQIADLYRQHLPSPAVMVRAMARSDHLCF